MTLTAKQEAFAQAVAGGMTQADAYRTAYDAENMSDNAIWREASLLIDNPMVSQRVEELKAKLEKKMLWTREMSVKGLAKAYKIAESVSNASGMTGAVKELNVMHGYNEPIKVDVKNTGVVGVIEMSKDEIIQAMKDRGLPTVIFDSDAA